MSSQLILIRLKQGTSKFGIGPFRLMAKDDRGLSMFGRILALISLLTIFNLAVAEATMAEDCRALITKNYTQETVFFRINPDDYTEPKFGNDHVARSFFFVRKLIEDLGCSRKAVNFSKGPDGRGQSRCHQIFRGKEHTRSCYIHTNLGFFFVTTDFSESVNLLYSRWD